MESKVLIRYLVMVFMVRMVAGEINTASEITPESIAFEVCYPLCFGYCMFTKHKGLPCALKCLGKCIRVYPSDDNGAVSPLDPHGACKLGCAFSMCSNISTPENPNEKAMGSCVNSCFGMCSGNQ